MTEHFSIRPLYAEVVINRPLVRRPLTRETPPTEAEAYAEQALLRTFTYLVPEALRDHITPGQLVEVPFRDDTLLGVVMAVHDTPPPDVQVRPITTLLDATFALSDVQLQLARWLSLYYLAPLSECIWLFLPPGVRRASQPVAEALPDKVLPPDIDARAAALYLYLQRHGATPTAELDVAALKPLVDIGAVRLSHRLAPPRVTAHMDRTVELIVTPEEAIVALQHLGRPSKQADVLLHLATLDDPLPVLEDVLKAVGCGEGVVRQLAARGYVRLTPARTLVATSLTGEALQAALQQLSKAPAQRAALAFLGEHPGPHDLATLSIAPAVLSALVEKGYVQRWDEPATVTLALDSEEVFDAVLELRHATTMAAVIDLLAREGGRVWVGWVYVQTGADLETLRRLAAAGLVALDEERRWRDPLADRYFALERPPRLTPEQEVAWRAISAPEAAGRAFLLHGVTSSGKTEVYLQAVASALEQGKGAIVLVPEIALAAQTVQRVAARFPGKVAVWHSDLSLGARFDTWQRVRAGQLPIVVGARSALFAPVRNLGLIVVDEEHEPAYKAERTPRYHAREVALQLGRLTGATIVLGSATPDVVTYRRAERGELQLLTLPRRVLAHHAQLPVRERTVVGNASPDVPEWRTLPLPRVHIVSLSEELKAGNRSILSRLLQQAIQQTLDAGQQVLLFLNRRGTATFVLCRDCGYVARCARCRTPLTYHEGREMLVCHHCNRRQVNPTRCPQCRGQRIRYLGIGTERVEATVREMFPQARVLRWDADTARLRGSHEAFLQDFISGRANVLVGTQMIAKGLDLPRVTLVGVINADIALYLPDFRAAERTFQLLMQVAGRAGRSPLGGQVIIQTYHPELPLIQAAARHDYTLFYRDELRHRRQAHYPPFKRLARLIYVGSGAERAQHEAERMAQQVRLHVARTGTPGVEIIGPAPCFYERLGGDYRWHILIRADRPEEVLRPVTLPIGWRVDIDPVDLL
ncbi:MAG: primosomal protein N' [Anaerolineae bacterium]|nr:primosomal protein N' [Anaerolineae bacterium]MDW8070037.1 primosomal protein N' [Anaerolineae bacterium]